MINQILVQPEKISSKWNVFKILTQPMVQPAMGGVGNLMAEAINKCSLDASF